MVPQSNSPPPDLYARARDPEALARANINPVTRLATDYLNHFNEIIMLLEMLESCPEFVPDILGWEPRGYVEYFERSTFKDRALALVAFEMVDHGARRELDDAVCLLNGIIAAVLEALRLDLSPEAAGRLGAEAVGWLKPVVARAGGVINAEAPASASSDEASRQARIDAVFAHAG